MKKNKSLEKEELLYSMNYAKESTKMKMYKTISNVIVTLITVIILTIVFNNLKISVFFNHHYYPNVMFIDDVGAGTVEQLFSNIEKKIVPKTVPIKYVPKTPLPSGEFIPYFSEITPNDVSLLILEHAPIASLLNPNIKAKGSATIGASICPNS